VSDAGRRSALAALDSARPAIARLDQTRHPEELAADLIESWSAVETALRSLVGGTTLTGQGLLREARQRQLLNFEQANALAEFHAAAERAQRTDYQPSSADLSAARDAFLKLEAGLMTSSAPTSSVGPSDRLNMEGMRSSPLGIPETVPPPRAAMGTKRLALIGVVALVVLVGLGVAGYALGWFSNQSGALERGISYYRGGQREAAVGEFTKASRDDPQDPLPHVYLSRMAREVGNMTVAGEEAQRAVELAPTNGLALRELGLYLLSAGNFDLSRKFLVRAVQANGGDKMAMGYLGCTLFKLGRPGEGSTWMTRAGPGEWSRCAQAPPMAPAGAGVVPQGYAPPSAVRP
jgi:tetratricopeptide (TPR) repeat protein